MLKRTLFRIFIILALAGLAAALVLVKRTQLNRMKETQGDARADISTVSTFEAEERIWRERLSGIGSVEPVEGVTLQAEVPGVVESIHFENGSNVKAGDLLVQLDVDVEKAELRSAKANLALAEIQYLRSKRLRESGNVPESNLDEAAANFEQAKAEVENIEARIARKTIRAPFAGETGIRRVNLGRYVSPGEPLVSLQAYEEVFVNFTLPQKELGRVQTGTELILRTDAFPEEAFKGRVTAVNPEVDPVTRSVEVQGTFDNDSGALRSGLFGKVQVNLPKENEVVVVPETAIQYAPYGNSVYHVESKEDQDNGDSRKVVRQKFVQTGERRGDFISIEEGVSVGDTVVSAGVFKLKNDQQVRINNEDAPEPELDPKPDNS